MTQSRLYPKILNNARFCIQFTMLSIKNLEAYNWKTRTIWRNTHQEITLSIVTSQFVKVRGELSQNKNRTMCLNVKIPFY